ncbi:hypothetical protein OROMI_007784 [Orobanche minor]
MLLSFIEEETVAIAESNADIIVEHMALILFIGPKMAMSLNRSVILVRPITDAAHRIIPEAIFAMECHISETGEAEYVLKKTKGFHGFYGVWRGFQLNKQ